MSLQGALDFVKWAAETGNPVRLQDGRIVKWDSVKNTFVDVYISGVGSLYVGEIGKANVSVRESCISLKQTLSANDISKVEFEVYDPKFLMAEQNYFVLDRVFAFNGMFYKTTAVTLATSPHEHVRVIGSPVKAQGMKESYGYTDYGAISPTEYASNRAVEHQLRFFGAPSPAGEPIIRTLDEDTEETTWDVLKSQAGIVDFSVFEANEVLFFASDSEIIAAQPLSVVNVPSLDTDELVSVSTTAQVSVTDRFSSRVDLQLVKNVASTSLFPGAALEVNGIGNFGNLALMVENVVVDAMDSELVRVSARANEDPGWLYCTTRTFGRGDTGFCVLRIQQALKFGSGGLTGEYGPYTEQKVREMQTLFGLPVTGVFDADDWALIQFLT